MVTLYIIFPQRQVHLSMHFLFCCKLKPVPADLEFRLKLTSAWLTNRNTNAHVIFIYYPHQKCDIMSFLDQHVGQLCRMDTKRVLTCEIYLCRSLFPHGLNMHTISSMEQRIEKIIIHEKTFIIYVVYTQEHCHLYVFSISGFLYSIFIMESRVKSSDRLFCMTNNP